MKITYTQNPLLTVVEPDELEIEKMRYKIMCDDMTDLLFTVHFELSQENPNMDRIKEVVNPDYYLNDNDAGVTNQEQHVQEILQYYIKELQLEHGGDCTCFPASCPKCHAESLLGIDTIKGLGKHECRKIAGAFRQKVGDLYEQRTINEAIEHLKNYDPVPQDKDGWEKVGGYEQYIPRWTQEAATALAWLQNYKDEHFKELS